MTRLSLRHGSDAGATLVELLVALVIGTLITGAIASALIVGFRTSDDTTTRLAESHDEQIIANYLQVDVTSSAPSGITTASSDASGCASAPVLGSSSVVVLPYASGAGDDSRRSAYRLEPGATGRKLVRYHCPTGGVSERILLASNVSATGTGVGAAVTTAPNGQSAVTLSIKEVSGFSYKVTGHGRTPTPPSPLPTAPSPTSAPPLPCRVPTGGATATPNPSTLAMVGGTTLVSNVGVHVDTAGTCAGPLTVTFDPGDGTKTVPLDAAGDGVLDKSAYAWTASVNKTLTVHQTSGPPLLNADFNLTVDSPPSPTIATASPTNRGIGAVNQNIAITGTNFLTGAVVTMSNGITVNSTTVNSGTSITANISLTGATAGPVTITITNPDAGVATNNELFMVTGTPTLTSAAPNARGKGAINQDVILTGTNFVAGATATFTNGITVNSTTFTDATHLRANVSLTTATLGAATITVNNNNGGAVSNTTGFTVTAAPTLTSIAPASLARKSANKTVVVAGTNFVSGATVLFSGSGSVTVNTATFTSATTLTLNITVDNSKATYGVTVTNPDGGTVTSPNRFQVT